MRKAVIDGIKSVFSGEASGSEAAAIIVLAPLNLALAYTVPDCREPHLEKYAYATFALSILWIAIFAIFMVECIVRIGCIGPRGFAPRRPPRSLLREAG